MTRIFVATALVVGLLQPAYADVTLTQTVNGKGLGMSAQTTSTTYIKGPRMRSDTKVGDRIETSIFDLDAQKMFIFNSKKKEADVWDMASFSEELSKSVDTASMKVSLTPNGQTKRIAGRETTGYDLAISMSSAMAGSNDLTMNVDLSGPTWIAKDAPGTADVLAFYKAAAEKGWVLSDPRGAKASPGPARAMTEMYRQLAEAGGIPYETNMQIKISAAGGGNPFAGLLARMGNVTSASVVESVETTGLGDELFAPPAGYKLNQKK